QSDAHSWVEVWLGPDVGWRPFDPTPSTRAPIRSHGLGDMIAEAIDALRLEWIQTVLSYDMRDQLELGHRVFELLGRARRGAGSPALGRVAWPVLAAGAVRRAARRRPARPDARRGPAARRTSAAREPHTPRARALAPRRWRAVVR